MQLNSAIAPQPLSKIYTKLELFIQDRLLKQIKLSNGVIRMIKIKHIPCDAQVKIKSESTPNLGSYMIVTCPVCGKKEKLSGWWDGVVICDMQRQPITDFTYMD